jgi:hypothetical protein
MSAVEITRFQLFEPVLCMDMGDFQLAVCDALGESFFTAAFGDHNIIEYMQSKFIALHGTSKKA